MGCLDASRGGKFLHCASSSWKGISFWSLTGFSLLLSLFFFGYVLVTFSLCWFFSELCEDYFSCSKQKQGPGLLIDHLVLFPFHSYSLLFAFSFSSLWWKLAVLFQVRHYYYRLVRRMNKLLGPELSLDAKNPKDTNAAMLRWYVSCALYWYCRSLKYIIVNKWWKPLFVIFF